MTILRLCVDSTCTSANVPYEITEEGGYRWRLPYYVSNVSEYPAFDVAYYHTLSTLDSIPTPDDASFEKRWQGSIVLPSEVMNCGYDEVLRQQVIDTLKAGKTLYRHFIVKFADSYSNVYVFDATYTLPDPMGDSVQQVGVKRFVPIQ